MSDECICNGNWRSIVKEAEALIDKRFMNIVGDRFTFYGVVHGGDDYYYGMCRDDGKCYLLSCVGSIKGHGFELIEDAPLEARDTAKAKLEAE